MTGGAADRGSEAAVRRAGAWVDAGRPEQALADLAEAEREGGESLAGHRVRALAMLALDRPGDGLAAARRGVSLAPDDSTALRVLSTVLVRSGDRHGALDAARRAVAADPGSWYAHLAVAEALWSDEHRRAEALGAASEAVRLAPGEPYAHRRLGDLLLASGRQRDAQTAYRQSLRLAPDDSGARHNLAVSGLRRGRGGESVLAFASMLAADPTNATARRNLVVGTVAPFARSQLALSVGAAFSGLQRLAALDGRPAGGWATTVPTAIALAAVVVVLRFSVGTRTRLRALVSAMRRAAPGVDAVAVIVGISLALSVAALFLPSPWVIGAQGLVLLGVVVVNALIARTMRAFPRTRTTTTDEEDDDDDR